MALPARKRNARSTTGSTKPDNLSTLTLLEPVALAAAGFFIEAGTKKATWPRWARWLFQIDKRTLSPQNRAYYKAHQSRAGYSAEWVFTDRVLYLFCRVT